MLIIGNVGFPDGSTVKNLPANAWDMGLIFGSGRSPEEGNDNPPSLFLPGKPHGQKSLMGYSPGDCKRVGQDLATKQQQQQHWRYAGYE